MGLLGIADSIIAAIFYASGQGIYERFSDPLRKSIEETSIYFLNEKDLELEIRPLITFLTKEACEDDLNTLVNDEGLIDGDALALRIASLCFGEIYYPEKEKLNLAKEFINEIQTRFENKLILSNRAPKYLLEFIKVFRNETNIKSENIISGLELLIQKIEVLSKKDEQLSPEDANILIRAYLSNECDLIKEIRKISMGEATRYMKPVLKTYLKDKYENDHLRYIQKRKAFREYNFIDLLNTKKTVVITADSGLGKSTLMQELFLRLAENWTPEEPIPFLLTPIGAQNLIQSTYPQYLENLLRETGVHVQPSKLTRLVSDLISKKKILYLIDALDQISTLDKRIGVIEFFAKQNIGFCTTRPNIFNDNFSKLSKSLHLELQPFSPKDIKDYYGDLLKRSQLSNIKDDFLSFPIIARMIVGFLSGESISQIQTRSQLYRSFFYKLLNRPEDKSILEKNNCDPEDIIDILRILSFKTLMQNAIGQAPRSIFKDMVNRRADINMLLEMQIFKKITEEGDTFYTFRHRSFQEYLAGEVLYKKIKKEKDVKAGIDKIRSFLFHPHWEEPVRFCAGLLSADQFEELLHKIIYPEKWMTDQEANIIICANKHLELALICASETVFDCKLNGEIINQLLSKKYGSYQFAYSIKSEIMINSLFTILTGKDRNLKFRATNVLNWIRSEAAVVPLIKFLQGNDTELISSATFALGQMKSKAAIGPLIELLQSSDENIASSAALALGYIGSEVAVIPLVETLNRFANNWKSTSAMELSHNAFHALKIIRSETAVDPLISILKRKDDIIMTRVYAIEILFTLQSKSAIEPLIEVLKGENKKAAKNAVCLLGQMNSEAAVLPLVKLLRFEDAELASVAINSLGLIASEVAVESLIEITKSEDKKLAKNAVDALGWSRLDVAIDRLIEITKGEDKELAKNAITALGSIKLEVADDRLIEITNGEDKELAKNAIDVLGWNNSKLAVDPLINILRNENKKLARRAAFALCYIGSEASVESLIEITKGEDKELAELAINTLGRIQSKLAVDPLINILRNENKKLVRSAARALGHIGSEVSVDMLVELLKDRDFMLRDSVKSILSTLQSKSAIEPLIEVLNRDNEEATKDAAYVLGEMKSEAAVLPLIELLNNRSIKFVTTIVDALGKIKADLSINPLINRYKQTNDVLVQYHIGTALLNIYENKRKLIHIEE